MQHSLTKRITLAGIVTLGLGLSPTGGSLSASSLSVDVSRGDHGLDADASGSLVAPDAERDEPVAAVVGAAAAVIDLASGASQLLTPFTSGCEPSVTVAAGRVPTTCPQAGGDDDTPTARTSLVAVAMHRIDHTVGLMYSRIASPLGPDARSNRADRPVGRRGSNELGQWTIDGRNGAILGFVGSLAVVTALICAGFAAAHLRPRRLGAVHGAIHEVARS